MAVIFGFIIYAKQIKESNSTIYEQKTRQNKTFLLRKLIHLRYKDGQSMSDHMNDFQEIINQLSNLEILLLDELRLVCFLVLYQIAGKH